MSPSLPVRVAAALVVCSLVGSGLAIVEGPGRARQPVAVVTRSRVTIEGALRGSTSDGILLDVAGRPRVVPWAAVAEVLLTDAPPAADPALTTPAHQRLVDASPRESSARRPTPSRR